jgi:HSP20 family protein
MTENEKAYLVTMELPGIDMTKTDISYNEGILTVKGEKQTETGEGECCQCSERYSGSFQRRLRIPGKVDTEKIDASYRDGILKLTLPKVEEDIPKKITAH